jgi:hypothetical protein
MKVPWLSSAFIKNLNLNIIAAIPSKDWIAQSFEN